MLLLIACGDTPSVPVFRPRRDLAGSIQTAFGAMRSAGIQHLCLAPEVHIGTVVDVSEPEFAPEIGADVYRLTLRNERTLRGSTSDTFQADTTHAASRSPTPGPGRYLMATSTTENHAGRVTMWATIDVADDARLLPLPFPGSPRRTFDFR